MPFRTDENGLRVDENRPQLKPPDPLYNVVIFHLSAEENLLLFSATRHHMTTLLSAEVSILFRSTPPPFA